MRRLVLVIGMLACPLWGETAGEMLSRCKQIPDAKIEDGRIGFVTHDFDEGVCWGAFSIIQRIIVMADPDKQPTFKICSPKSALRNQHVAIFVEYLRRNPQRLHEEFLHVALDALRAAFPCGKP